MTANENRTREELDAQYNLRARHPDHPRIFKRWAHSSDEARQRFRCELDLPYGPSEKQCLDIFHAAGAGPHPILAFIHGGYWQAMDKAEFGFLAPPFSDAGVTTAMINYTLAPTAGIHEIIAETRTALVWLWRNAATFQGDPGRIFVCGHSAGGHLTAMCLTTDWPRIEAGLPSDLVKAGCAISGLYDLEPIRRSYLNQALGMDAADARRASPIHLKATTASPLLVSVGGEETEAFHRQQAAFVEAWAADGVPVETVDMPGRNHFTIMDALADPRSALFGSICRMISGFPASEGAIRT